MDITPNILTHFSPVLPLIQEPIIWLAVQIKRLVSIWNATLSRNELNNIQYITLSPADTTNTHKKETTSNKYSK